MKRFLELPYKEEDLLAIRCGDEVLISGYLYVGRDQVHKRLKEAIDKGAKLPFEFAHNGIYYMGPSPAPEGFAIGSAGPTTSARMDPFSPLLLEHSLRLMVGKGPRSEAVKEAIRKHKGVYLQAYGGCGALYCSRIIASEPVAYEDLGPEALIRLKVESFPAICMIDSEGNCLR